MTNEHGEAKGIVPVRRLSAQRAVGWSLALLASTALVAVPPALAPFGFGVAALAAGGDGYGNPGGAGGGDNATYNGNNGVDIPVGSGPAWLVGGGGGGAGVLGGLGGKGGGGSNGGAGGARGASAGAAGGDGGDGGSSSGSGGAGGGGGGGAHGYYSSSAPTQAVTGGAGGNGGGGYYGGGGGGAGGYGAVLSGSGPYQIDFNITGGNGGAGGGTTSTTNLAYGGDGGHGLVLSSSGASVTVSNSVTIKGGNGGGGAAGSVGGTGIMGSGLTLSLASGATVSGGLSGDGVTRANAITFTGGQNVLTLQGNGGTSGQTYANIIGNVVGATGSGTSNSLQLAGAGGLFDLSKLDARSGNGAQFENFDTTSVNSTGTWIVTGDQAGSTGASWKIDGGTLQLGSATATAKIRTSALSGINNGGTLAIGAMGATIDGTIGASLGGTLKVGAISGGSALTVTNGSLYFDAGSTLALTLGAPTTTAVLSVARNFTYKGALTIADNGQMAEGTYTVASYGGSIGAGSGFTTVTGPSDYTYTVAQDTTNQLINLTVVSLGLYWNGTTVSGSGPLDGGTGTWTAASGGVLNWSNSGGTTHVVTDPTKKAVFAATAGTVTVDASQGAVAAKGLKFITTGYEITGAELTLVNASAMPKVEVVGASTSATISAPVAGTQGLEKIGDGTLVLTGANTYTGGTTITAGTLQIGNGGTSGVVTGDIADNAVLIFNRSDDSSYAGAISGTGKLEKAGAGTLTVTGSHTYTGTTTVSGGTLSFAGGTSTIGSTIVSIGPASGSVAALDVTGASTSVTFSNGTWNLLRVGDVGTGTLSVTDGGSLSVHSETRIGNAVGATGTATVTGPDSTWAVTGGGLYTPAPLQVGYFGTGTLTVSDGGTVTSPVGSVGRMAGSTGTVTVTGSGSSWTLGNGTVYGGSLNVGDSGNGTLTVAAGGTVSADYFTAAADRGTEGAVTITGNKSAVSVTNDTIIGYFGVGTLTIADGGKLTGSRDAYVGYYGGVAQAAASTATVTGTGSTWNQSAGDLTVGTYSSGTIGTLLVEKGGTVTSKGGTLAADTGVVGTVTVTGAGSSWTVGADGLTVGSYGTGTLTVSDGATMTGTFTTVGWHSGSTGTLTVSDGAKIHDSSTDAIGYLSGSKGSATITGSGSQWDADSNLNIGFYGEGKLTISNGGVVNSPSFSTIGYNPGSTGTVIVTGSGSAFNLRNSVAPTSGLTVGYYGNGTLTVSAGASVSSDDVAVGWQGSPGFTPASTGTVTVSGSGTTLTTNELDVGYGGIGTLTVNGGAVVTVGIVSSGAAVTGGIATIGSDSGSSGTVTVTDSQSLLDVGTSELVLAVNSGSTASLTVANGGTVAAGQIAKGNAGGTASLSLDGGTLKATVAEADYLKGFAAGDVTLASGGGTLDTNGFDIGVAAAIGGTGGLTKVGAGTLTLTGANTFTGLTQVTAGTLQISGGGSLAGGVDAQAGTTLTGDPTGASTGSVAGAVSVQNGATLAMVSGSTTLTLGSLTLGSTATVATTLLAPSTTAAVGVTGNLVLAGTLDLTAGTGFASGTYRLFDYGGVLSGAGLTLGTTPAHNLFAVDTATSGQVNLIVAQGQYWNGMGGSGANGGSGTWDAGATANWTDAAGTTGTAWNQGSLAIFGGTAGTVTVATGTAPQAAGLEFDTSGYTLAGGPVTLTSFHGTPFSRVLVDDGTAGGGTATVASALTGTQGLDKVGPGTLVLSGTNTYTGETKVTAGTLQIGAGGSLAGDVAVGSGAVLGGDPAGAGTGSVAGNVTVAAGGGLNLVTGTTTLSVGGALTLDPAASVSVLVLAPSATAAAHVGGNLTLAGTLDLTAGAGFGSGTYRLFDYGGSLSGAGLTLGARPAHSLFAVDTGTSGQVNLVVASGQWWNGAVTTPGGTAVAGGTGTWDVAAATTNWTDTAGAAANAWSQGSLAIFGGTAGTVTVGATAPQAAGLEFVTSGYTVTGGGITLVGFHGDPSTRILVDDNTASGGTATIASSLSGSQTLEKTGAGTLVLAGTNTYSGGTTVSAGALQIGNGGTTGSVAGAIAVAVGASVVFDRADDLTAAGPITGAGALVQRGSGTLTLTGSHSAGAGTTVAAGTLALADGAQLASDVTVQSGASLTARNAGATPTVAGIVTVQTGATLNVAPAAGGDGLSTTGLVLASGSHLAVTLGAPTGHAAVSTGSLALDGVLDVTAGSGLMQGVYRIIDYTTLASDNGLQLGATPTGFTYAIQRQTGQVNLAVSGIAGPGILYWNGPQTTAGGTIQGGSGTWSSDPTRTNWTDAAATQAQSYQRAFAVFGGTGGAVTVDASKGALAVGGLQFTAGGYTLSGDAITLDDASGLTQVRVGDGTAAGAGTVATIASVLAGTGGLVKTDLGTLVLSGANTYAGDTQVKGGTLALAGSVDGDIYVYDQATLSGGGKVGKTVHVLDGGTLAGGPGAGLTMAGLDLAGKATLAVTLGAAGGAGVFQVNGNVTLGGTLAVTPGAGFGFGVYRIVNYTGRLTDTGMQVGALPNGALGGLQTSVAQQVNLFVEDPNNPVAIWNGGTTRPTQTVAGGSGTWSADPTTNWTNASGTVSRRWPSGFAVFQGSAGTATVDNSPGAVAVSGIQFADSGFQVAGGALTLAGPGMVPIRVGDGTAAGAATVATIASALTGTGGLEKSDYGTLVLTGTNTYTGGTRITAGTLQVGDGGTTGSVAGSIVNDARLVFARSDTYAVRGQLSGTGDLEFRGGTVQYGDNAGFTGKITARDAFVRLDPGTVSASAFTLESGSVLGGTATIGALTVNAGATAAPGYSPGTLTVTGAVAFNAGSTYAVDVTPDGRHDLITATGPVTLSSQAQVQVHATPGRYVPNSTYAILTTTASVSGRFAGVTSDYAFLKPTLSYDAQNVYLGLSYNERRFTDFARTRNQYALATAAQGLGMGNRVFDTLLNLPEGQVARAFDRLDGEGHASLNTVIQQQSAFLRDAVGARLRQSGSGDDALGRAAQAAGPATQSVDGDPSRTLWAQAYGGFGRRQGDGNAGAVASAAGGMLAGLDVELGDAVQVGVLGGLGRSSADVPSRDTSATFANYDVGLYGSGRFGALAVRGGFAQSWHDVSARRSVTIPGYTGTETAHYTVSGRQVFGEIATDVRAGAATVQPFAGLSYVSLDGHRVNERGSADAALSGTVRAQGVAYTSLGARAALPVQLGDVVLTPSVTLGWQHAFGDLAPRASLRFAGGSAFGVSGVPVERETALVGAGLSYDLSDVSAIRVNYIGQLAPKSTQNAFTAEYSHRF